MSRIFVVTSEGVAIEARPTKLGLIGATVPAQDALKKHGFIPRRMDARLVGNNIIKPRSLTSSFSRMLAKRSSGQ